MDRRTTLGAIGGSLVMAVAGRAAAATKRPPNIVFIMSDDHARSALSCYGNKILKTPNLDRIGAEGVRFDEAFVTNSLCLPSRASYLTGLYSHTHGMITNGAEMGFFYEPSLHDEATWPMVLRRAGYSTAVVGKWHLPTPPKGYDYAAVLQGQGDYFDTQMRVQDTLRTVKGYTDDVITDQALGFLKSRPKDQPFCLLYQFKAPHREWTPAPRFANAFKDIDIPEPPDLFAKLDGRPLTIRRADNRLADMLDYRSRGVLASMSEDERARRNYQFFIKDYYRVLLALDENVGRMLDYLDQEGLSDNTIIVYTTDNGFFLGENGFFDKRLMYEPSIRVPLLARWPAGLPKGVIDKNMVLNIDIAPTLLDAAGANGRPSMQGRSWLPAARGARPADWRSDFLYEYFEFPGVHCIRQHLGVRDQRWKLISWAATGEIELYDLANDPNEDINLAGRPEHAATQARLIERLAALSQATGGIELPGYLPGDPPNLYECKPLTND
jgi:arylsulfatase A-like enzyme